MNKLAGFLILMALAACGPKQEAAQGPAPAAEKTPPPLDDLSAVEVGTAAQPKSAPPQAQPPAGTPPQQTMQMTISEGATPNAVSDERKAALLGQLIAMGMEAAPEPGQVMNDCGEAITPSYYAANLGGEVGLAFLVVLAGGPNTLTCYGMTGMLFHLFKTEGEGYRRILTESGHLAVMETATNGVKDVAVGGPGFEFPVYSWNGKAYIVSRQIPDTEFPAALNAG